MSLILGALLFSILGLGSSLATTYLPTRTHLLAGHNTLTFPTSLGTRCALFARATDPKLPFTVDSGVCKVLDNSGGTVHLLGAVNENSVQTFLPAEKVLPGMYR